MSRCMPLAQSLPEPVALPGLSIPLVVGVVLGLAIVLPLINFLAVRYLVKLKDSPEPEPDPVPMEHIGEFWQAMLPHLLELRTRLVISLGALIVGSVAGYALVAGSFAALGLPPLLDMIPRYFLAPEVLPLQGVDVGETFSATIRLSLLLGLTLALPVILYQILRFFLPAMTASEKRAVFTALPFVIELFLAGLVFGWFVTVPAALRFLTEFGASETVKNVPRVSSFFNVLTSLLLWNGVIFLMPAMIYLLARLGVIQARQLAAGRRYALVLITIAAAIITPTGDPVNLVLLAAPMYVLYEFGIALARLAPTRRDLAGHAATS